MAPTRMPATPPHYEYRDEFGRRRSATASSDQGRSGSKSHPNVLSPPPSPTAIRGRSNLKSSICSTGGSSFSQRLRTSSGLSLHMNEDALRQYTDYNADGTSKGPLFRPFDWQSRDGEADEIPRRDLVLSRSNEWSLPIPDVFGTEIFQMVLKDPSAASGLLQFSRDSGYGVDMAYLSKTQEYSAVIDHLESVLYTISTNYTAITTATPVTLPSHISRSLNNDLRYVTGTILPGLERMFHESRACVEQRVVKDLYPAFVKHQLALATAASLASHLRMPEAEYPGLGAAFCITDCNDRDRIKYASDEFAALLGREREEILHGNVTKLQGGMNHEAGIRMQHAISKEQECVELIVSYRKTGEPFWNLIYLCPLPDLNGKSRCCLHCYINVSDRIKSSAEVLRLLGNLSLGPDMAPRSSIGSTPSARSRSPSTPVDHKDHGRSSSHDKNDLSRSTSSRKLFATFRKAATVPHTVHANKSDSALAGPGVHFDEPTLPSLGEDNGSASLQPVTTAYSCTVLLKYIPGVKPKLRVAHASRGALELMNPSLTIETIQDRDLFKVLAEEARSPSVTRSFKSAVQKGVLDMGERVTAEVVFGEVKSRKGSVISIGRGSDDSSRNGGRRAAMHVNCFFTPLREARGVEWVVMVMVPAG